MRFPPIPKYLPTLENSLALSLTKGKSTILRGITRAKYINFHGFLKGKGVAFGQSKQSSHTITENLGSPASFKTRSTVPDNISLHTFPLPTAVMTFDAIFARSMMVGKFLLEKKHE